MCIYIYMFAWDTMGFITNDMIYRCVGTCAIPPID